MERKDGLSLHNPALRGRIRGPRRESLYHTRPASHPKARLSDVLASSHSRVNQTDSRPLNQLPRPGTAQSSTSHSPPQAIRARTAAKTQPHLPKQQPTEVLKRYAIRPPSTPIRPRSRRLSMPMLLTGMAVILFVTGSLVAIVSIHANRTVKAQVKVLSQQTSKDDTGISEGVPSEVESPGLLSKYQVAADLPRSLSIDKIGVNAIIRRLGMGPNNVLNSPANIFEIGWYDGSSKPGESGTVVLDGHVSGPTKHGVFYSIGTLKAGDKVKLERGDGKVFTYTVTDTKTYDNDKVDMAKVMTSSVAGKPGLNFMTCSGRFNVRTNQFEQRAVVFTVQD